MHKQYQTMHLKTKNEVKYWRKMWKWCCSSGKTQGLGFSMHQGPSNFASHEIKMSSYIYIYMNPYICCFLFKVMSTPFRDTFTKS